ncbi:hypothetical protein GF373_15140 [bacterium]|nr:hypothetical protein [bacterium]
MLKWTYYSCKNWQWFLIPLIFLGFIGFLASCGKKKPPETLGIRLLEISGEWDASAYKKIIEDYAAANPELIVEVTAEAQNLESVADNPLKSISHTDVCLFPSLLIDSLTPLKSSFYPLSATSASFYPLLHEGYQKTETESWAIPLTFDPVLCIVKKGPIQSAGRSVPVEKWSSIRMASNELLGQDKPFPHIGFVRNGWRGLTDGFAALQLSYGYASHSIRDADKKELMDKRTLERYLGYSTNGLKSYFAPEDEPVSDLLVFDSLQAFLENESVFITFARLSDVESLPKDQQDQVVAGLIPSKNPSPVLPGYAVAASIPLSAQNPSRAKAFIQYLTENLAVIAKQTNTVAGKPSVESGRDFLSPDTYCIVRKNGKSIQKSDLIQVFNGEIPVKDCNQKWEEAYSIPEPEKNN